MFRKNNKICKLLSSTTDISKETPKNIHSNFYQSLFSGRIKYNPVKNIAVPSMKSGKKSLCNSLSIEETLPLTNCKISRPKATRTKIINLLNEPKFKHLTLSSMSTILNDHPKEDDIDESVFEGFYNTITNAKFPSQLTTKQTPFLSLETKSSLFKPGCEKPSQNTLMNSGINSEANSARNSSKSLHKFKRKDSKLLSVNLKKNLLEEDDDMKIIEHRRGSASSRLLLKICSPLDCVEEHIIKNVRPEDKFAKFKLLLKRKEAKMIKLLNQVREIANKNDNLLKVYITQLDVAEYKRTRSRKYVRKFLSHDEI